MHTPTVRAALAAFVLATVVSAAARAAVVTVPFGHEYTSGDVPAGPGPWLTATFDDHDAAGSVTLTLRSHLTGPGEFVTAVLFNLDPSLDPRLLTVSAPTKAGAFADPAAAGAADGFSAGGGSRFDLRFEFDHSPPASRFGAGDVAAFTLGGIPTLRADSFAFLSTGGGSGPLLASAHIQGVGARAEGSGWVSVPEPSAAALALLAAPLLLARRRGTRRGW